MQSPEVVSKIQELRAKSIAGTITLEETREAIMMLRQDRRSAAIASETSRRAKARKEVKSASELLAELGKI